jgi:hypothetical protein
MRLLWTHKELGEPLTISSDDVTNWCIKEALLTRQSVEQEKNRKQQEKEAERKRFKQFQD